MTEPITPTARLALAQQRQAQRRQQRERQKPFLGAGITAVVLLVGIPAVNLTFVASTNLLCTAGLGAACETKTAMGSRDQNYAQVRLNDSQPKDDQRFVVEPGPITAHERVLCRARLSRLVGLQPGETSIRTSPEDSMRTGLIAYEGIDAAGVRQIGTVNCRNIVRAHAYPSG